MKASLTDKLLQIQDRFEELGALLSDSEVIGQQEKFRAFSKEYAELEPVVLSHTRYLQACTDLSDSLSLAEDSDPDIREMAAEEAKALEQSIRELEHELEILLLPNDPNDQSNAFLEIRAGTGGDEAAIFAGDLLKMYLRYAEGMRWNIEVLSDREGEHGGFKEVIARVSGSDVYGHLKFESGAHRVQRVPQTESQGRIHTSACTVAVMPEDERSQHKNRARAMSLLQAKLLDKAQSEQTAEQAQQRRSLVGSGDRSEKIRTYNYPDGRVTDHRINLTLHRLQQIMAGELEAVIDPLRQEHQADLLSAMGLDGD